jgi:hypothetical protein
VIRNFANLAMGSAVAFGLLGIAAAPAAAFQPGDVYWAPGTCDSPPCYSFRVDAGVGTTAPFVAIDPAPGQFAWAPNLSAVYATQFGADTILRISSAGAVSVHASGINDPTGLLMTSGGTLLAVSFGDGAVYDATAGGDLAGASAFATGFLTPRNLLERSNGDILLVDQNRLAVYEISGGGDFSVATPFADGFSTGAYDVVEGDSGNLYLATHPGVFEITSGGNFSSALPHAWGRRFIGLSVDGVGRLLGTELDTGAVFDISGGGDYTAVAPAVNVAGGLGDSALDTVPPGAGGAPVVPALGPLAYGMLASLLVAAGARSIPR